ncbi:MAG: rod shape-determining protein MreC [Cyanobacteriota bacterium]|nr:rod shape-determining protein MreC [Cyanobacteriota bacterium]
MPARRWLRFSTTGLAQAWPWLLLLTALAVLRLSKGALLSDAYALLSRPFWPGTAQSEWLRSARRFEDRARIAALESENARLRGLVGLQQATPARITAPVIARDPAGWWQTLLLGRGALQGVREGSAVLAPGGLIGLVSSVTPTTARVTLLTDPSSRVGVWVARTRHHGLLTGLGTDRPVIRFLEKDPGVVAGDVITTSPASTLVPPDLPVGVIQSVDVRADPAPEAVLQLAARAASTDWVQVVVR